MDQLDNTIDRRLSEFEAKFKLYVDHAGDQIVAGHSTWFMPFVGLSIVSSVLAAGAYWKWRDIARKNFLD